MLTQSVRSALQDVLKNQYLMLEMLQASVSCKLNLLKLLMDVSIGWIYCKAPLFSHLQFSELLIIFFSISMWDLTSKKGLCLFSNQAKKSCSCLVFLGLLFGLKSMRLIQLPDCVFFRGARGKGKYVRHPKVTEPQGWGVLLLVVVLLTEHRVKDFWLSVFVSVGGRMRGSFDQHRVAACSRTWFWVLPRLNDHATWRGWPAGKRTRSLFPEQLAEVEVCWLLTVRCFCWLVIWLYLFIYFFECKFFF